MRDKQRDSAADEPSLELPSLSLPGLRRRKKAEDTAAPESPEPDEGRGPDAAPDEPRKPEPSEPEEPVEQTRTIAPPPAETPATSSSREGFKLPALPGMLAVALTGVVVGLVGTLLTYLAMLGCEAVRGTSTCGGPGFFFLIAILIVMILLGMTLLRAWRIADAGSTSFLAVGLVAVAVLVVLIDVIFSGWMFLVVPIVAAGAYALSHWVTTRFVDEDRDRHR